MSLTSRVTEDAVNIYVEGNFDIGCYDEFNKALNDNLNTSSKFVIDLSKTTYMDSSALGMMLLLREKLGGQSSKVEFINVNDSVMKILCDAKFDQLFTINP
ncbi:MAG: STAS domain-containing protein [Hydrogenovibrio crunogenus]|uniref:Anti-sigma-factor antagonist (STAS) domain protein n=1 Tax=Hydrogenovibrio crunogenus (strain DSM 25203 / XCL-2) TaxID=317025 RepID=Q31GU0_HYDCU|nr:STAS domain-containing protein [Hydrogenovibrio crunogenus]